MDVGEADGGSDDRVREIVEVESGADRARARELAGLGDAAGPDGRESVGEARHALADRLQHRMQPAVRPCSHAQRDEREQDDRRGRGSDQCIGCSHPSFAL